MMSLPMVADTGRGADPEGPRRPRRVDAVAGLAADARSDPEDRRGLRAAPVVRPAGPLRAPILLLEQRHPAIPLATGPLLTRLYNWVKGSAASSSCLGGDQSGDYGLRPLLSSALPLARGDGRGRALLRWLCCAC